MYSSWQEIVLIDGPARSASKRSLCTRVWWGTSRIRPTLCAEQPEQWVTDVTLNFDTRRAHKRWRVLLASNERWRNLQLERTWAS